MAKKVDKKQRPAAAPAAEAKKRQPAVDDEFSLQPLANEAATSVTHKAADAREQIRGQIHARAAEGGALPDLPPDAPEFEEAPKPPLFTKMALIRLAVLLTILVVVAVFVHRVYQNVFGQPIEPAAPEAVHTAADMLKPLPSTPPEVVAKPLPLPAPPPPATVPQPAQPAENPYLNSNQDGMLGPDELEKKRKLHPVETAPSNAGQEPSGPSKR